MRTARLRDTAGLIMARHWSAIALTIVLSAACHGLIGVAAMARAAAGEPTEAAGFSTIGSAELAERLTDKDFVFINVHIPYEGEIDRTDAFIPFDRIEENLDRLPADRDAAIILYCKSGRMSETAARELVGRGFTDVSHLSGGMVDWERSGYPLLRK